LRAKERTRGLLRSPKLIWDILFRGRYRFTYDQVTATMTQMSAVKRLNLLKAGANLVYRRPTPWSMPLHMQFELCNYCNLRCPVCPTGIKALKRKPRAMDAALFEKLIEAVGPYLLTASLWAWGEPLLHPQLLRILKAVRRHRIVTFLSTNGQNLNDEGVLDALLNEPPSYLIVAIDGLTDETNSQFRVGAKLDPLLAGVKRIAEVKRKKGLQLPILHMRFIVMKHNQHEVPQLIHFASSNHFDLLTVRTLSIIDNDSTHRIHGNLVPDGAEFQAYGYARGERITRSDFICQEPFWFPTVFSDGTLVACDQDFNAQHSFGVISDAMSFNDLWFSEHAALIRRKIRDHQQQVSFCRNCPYRDRESTDCSIQAFLLNRHMDNPDLFKNRTGRFQEENRMFMAMKN
jgi:radical SAM protein with 4Fe4S-binding SPASM domain